jgi:predicted amidohydrolase YtcJ
MTDLVVRRARVADWSAPQTCGGDRVCGGDHVDIRIERGRIVAVGPKIAHRPGDEVLDVSGSIVLPGLHDHHLHLRSLLATESSIAVGPENVSGWKQFADQVSRSSVGVGGWRRGVGYHESVAGELDRWSLDAIAPDAPMRVQHRTGVMWVLNTNAVDLLGIEHMDAAGIERDETGRPTGRLFRMDSWLSEQLSRDDPVLDVDRTSRQLASLGVTGLTDATPGATSDSIRAFVEASQAGSLVQRLHVMCPPETEVTGSPMVTRGPYKLLLDDDTLPALDDLADEITRSHDVGVPVAVHCVTRAQLVLTMSALEQSGVIHGDRLEHGSVVPEELISTLAAMGVTVVTNPGLVEARGDHYLDDVDPRDVPDLYRLASLRAGGVAVAGGTDAPFGPLNPWSSVSFACTRQTAGGRSLGEAEAVPLRTAIELFTGGMDDPAALRRVAPGEPADLCFLADGYLPTASLSGTVYATVIDGKICHLPL